MLCSLRVSPSDSLSVRLSVRQSVCPSVCRCLSFSVGPPLALSYPLVSYHSFIKERFVVGTFTDGVFLEALLVEGNTFHHKVVKHLWSGAFERRIAVDPRQKPRVQSENVSQQQMLRKLFQNTKEIKRTLFNKTEQDKTCKFSM